MPNAFSATTQAPPALQFLDPASELERRGDGRLLLRSPHAL
ncbi:MAG: hypothetical protein JWP52_3539, partial [Rhizobacter sp.]|nr:hypothetical protein [Rhizobacter sp.]